MISKQVISIACLISTIIFFGCDKWDETADVSHVSYLPEFELIGGDFISLVEDEGNFYEPGVNVTVNGKAINWYYLNSYLDTETPGIYIITYYAENDEGFSSTAERVIAVTYENVSNNDLSGTYTGTLWEQMESRITKLNDQGLYKCEEVLGFPGSSMPGRIVDLGENNLALLPGEGYFGKYDISEGSYTKRTVSWSVKFLDAPYEGLEIPVTWRKTE